MELGALNLASPEVKVQTDSETSDPVDVQSKELLETNSLVEEFMLLANISVARRIYEHFNDTAMLRYFPSLVYRLCCLWFWDGMLMVVDMVLLPQLISRHCKIC